jgi:phosphoglycerate dehydrogenase-like enzyme
MKAVLQYRATPGFRSQVSALQSEWLAVVVVDETDKATFAEEMQDADVLLHVLEPVGADVFTMAPRLKLVQKLGVGVDTIDLDAARRHGVAVCNMPGTNTRAVAELTLLLMLATLRRLAELHDETRRGNGWRLDVRTLDQLAELGGRIVGLVGLGAVGRCLMPMLHGFGCEVVYTDVQPVPGVPAAFLSFEEVLSTSDIVSLHLPLTDKTARLMNASSFALMKPGSILINAARGGLVDEPSLLEALVSSRLRGAGLDVFNAEPVSAGNPLLRLPNVVVTPHLAWFTSETLSRSLLVFVDNCRRVRDGEALLHRVV